MKRVIAAVGFGAAGLLLSGGAGATQQCRNQVTVPYFLTLESLTLDGQAVADLSPYAKVKWSMERVFDPRFTGEERGAVEIKAFISFSNSVEPLLRETYVP